MFSFINYADDPVSGNQLLSGHSDFTVARAAIYRSALAWLKWYLGVLTTFGANRGEHLACRTVVVALALTLCSPRFAALGASLGLVCIALGLEELLLLGAESEA